MSHELIVTSAPRGLKPGIRGFCTVAATDGMLATFQEALESLSGYEPLFPPLDPRAARNPVAFSHLRLVHAGKSYHLLSRVSSAGLDYSGRSNKLAHHFALEPSELPLGGPAWLLSYPALMCSSWQGEPRILPARQALPNGEPPVGVCRGWQETVGDAGWAGVVAQTLIKEPFRPVILLFEPGMELLPLVGEVFGLLSPEYRWQVSFSTYYTGLPQGIGCGLRGIVKGSPEAARASRLPGAMVIDLSSRLGAAPDGWLTELARTGKVQKEMALSTRPGEWPSRIAPEMAEPPELWGTSVASSTWPGDAATEHSRSSGAPRDAGSNLETPGVRNPGSSSRRSFFVGLFAGTIFTGLAALIHGQLVRTDGTKVSIHQSANAKLVPHSVAAAASTTSHEPGKIALGAEAARLARLRTDLEAHQATLNKQKDAVAQEKEAMLGWLDDGIRELIGTWLLLHETKPPDAGKPLVAEVPPVERVFAPGSEKLNESSNTQFDMRKWGLDPNKKHELELIGLPPGWETQRKGSDLHVVQGGQDKAVFQLADNNLKCSWRDMQPHAQRVVQDGLLKIKEPESRLEKVLGFRTPKSVSLPVPMIRAVDGSTRFAAKIDWGNQGRPTGPLYIDSVVIDVEGESYRIGMPGHRREVIEAAGEIKLKNGGILKSLRVRLVQPMPTGDKPDGQDHVEVDLGKVADVPSEIKLRSLVVYRKVEDLRVEVYRVGK